MKIKNRLIAVSAVLAMILSFTACSDDGSNSRKSSKSDSSAAEVKAPEAGELSSEDAAAIQKHDLTIEPYNPGGGVQQDAVESQDDNSGSGQQGGSDSSQAPNNGDNAQGGNDQSGNNQSGNNQSGNNQGGNTQNEQGGGQTSNEAGNNNTDIVNDTGLQVISGTKSIMQAYWMDISKKQDYVFNGEYLTAQFKIKDNAQNGIYPITVEWADFSNWDAKTIRFTTIDGAVVVGGEAKENTFNDGDEPQILTSNVSGKPGETVTVTFSIKNNPGVVANIFRFGYNSDALEYVGGGEGKDFNGHFQ